MHNLCTFGLLYIINVHLYCTLFALNKEMGAPDLARSYNLIYHYSPMLLTCHVLFGYLITIVSVISPLVVSIVITDHRYHTLHVNNAHCSM